LDPEKRRALSAFYREEFQRHLQHLQSNGIVGDTDRRAVDCACRWLTQDLDRVCWHADFPAMAESLLQSFEALTGLSSSEQRQAH
jgi:uncharacterized protein YmfQ (DUF2313 family)